MDRYTLSCEADLDIDDIARNSLNVWGLARAETYLLGLHEMFQRLHEMFQRLADFPGLGRDIGHIRPGYRRIETSSHSVFYKQMEGCILVVRVLHQRMNFEQHL